MSDFEIDGVGYDWPTSYNFGDSVVIRLAAELDTLQFAELLEAAVSDDDADAETKDAAEIARRDPRLLMAQVAVAVQRKHPRWSAQRVVDFVRSLDFDRLVFPDEPEEPAAEEEVDVGPPAEGAGLSENESERASALADSSPEPAETSNDEPGSDSDETPPSLSGAPS